MNFVKINEALTMKEGDTKNVYTATLEDSLQQPVDLTGATVNFHLAGEKLSINKVATVQDPANGVVTFGFDDNDVTGSGVMDGELQVVYSSGDKETFPTNGYLRFNIRANLLGRGEEVIQPSLITQYDDKIATQDAKINGISAKFPFVSVKDFTGGSDTANIQSAIDYAFSNNKKTVLLEDDEDYVIGSTITVKSGIELKFGYNTRFLIYGDFNVLELEKEASLTDPYIAIDDATFDSAVVYLDGKHKYYNSWFKTKVKNLNVINWSGSNKGIGIYCYSGDTEHEISFVDFENPKLVGLDTGIKLEAVLPPSGNAWVNANRFHNAVIEDCVTMIDLIGDTTVPNETSGNIFDNLQIQLSTATQRALRISGQYNVFTGMVWDDWTVSSGVKLFEFNSTSDKNDISGLLMVQKDRLLDNGTNNRTRFSEAPSFRTIEFFGAIPNDPSMASHNTTAINNAISSEKHVIVPDETYYVDGSITINSGDVIRGTGMNLSEIKGVNGMNLPIFDVQSGFNIQISDMEIAYDDWSPISYPNRNAIEFHDQVAHSSFKNLRFNSVYRAFYIDQTGSNNVFSCNFENIYCFWFAKNFFHLKPSSGANTGNVLSNLYCNNGERDNRLWDPVTPFYFEELSESTMMQLNAEWANVEHAFHFNYCRNVTLISPHIEGVDSKLANAGLIKVEGVINSPTQKGSVKILSLDLYDIHTDVAGTSVFEVVNNGVLKMDGMNEQVLGGTDGTLRLIQTDNNSTNNDSLYLDDIRTINITDMEPPVDTNADGSPKLKRLNDSHRWFTMPGTGTNPGEYRITIVDGAIKLTLL